MTTLLYVLFWLSLFLVIYNYLLYPLLVFVLSRFRELKHDCYTRDDDLPSVCLIIPALGDVATIRTKIRNTLRLSYPEKKLILLTISDKNDTAVQALLTEYKKHHIINFCKRGIDNTYHALDLGAKLAKTNIIIFSDVRNELNDMAVRNLARHFKDPAVGAVSGVRSLYTSKSSQASVGDNLYWKYETFIKNAESRLGSITGAAGELLAIRKSLYQTIDKGYINFDSAITFKLIEQGYRVILEDEALSLMDSSRDMKNSFHERVTMARAGFQTLFREWRQLFSFKSWFTFSYHSHKTLRLFIPFLLIALFLIPFWLLEDPVMILIMALQLVFYILALAGWFLRDYSDTPAFIKLAIWYVSMNAAVLVGLVRFIIRI
jgi:poly-beta-1,6-N-acetyl-D-glucosamine synthase